MHTHNLLLKGEHKSGLTYRLTNIALDKVIEGYKVFYCCPKPAYRLVGTGVVTYVDYTNCVSAAESAEGNICCILDDFDEAVRNSVVSDCVLPKLKNSNVQYVVGIHEGYIPLADYVAIVSNTEQI